MVILEGQETCEPFATRISRGGRGAHAASDQAGEGQHREWHSLCPRRGPNHGGFNPMPFRFLPSGLNYFSICKVVQASQQTACPYPYTQSYFIEYMLPKYLQIWLPVFVSPSGVARYIPGMQGQLDLLVVQLQSNVRIVPWIKRFQPQFRWGHGSTPIALCRFCRGSEGYREAGSHSVSVGVQQVCILVSWI